MRRWLLIATALSLASTGQAQTVHQGQLAFTAGPKQMLDAEGDTTFAAWCSNVFTVTDSLVAIREMHVTSQVMNPPCGTDAIVIRRPNCAIHFYEWLRWTIDHPPLVVAICPGHYAIIWWPRESRT